VGSSAFFHGRCLAPAADPESYPNSVLSDPRVTWASDQKPRDDHDAPSWLTATEFCDTKAAMNMKIEKLAQLLRISRRTVVYSGAGISVAAGIGQAARGTASGRATTDASPTFTHLALGALANAGYIHSWEQQNHDGLPQKAGVPQEILNEIHGSWFDPSNPVVKYSGNLKDHNYEWMERDATEADLVLVLGTSLGGLNADQIATNCASRSCRRQSLGFVHINLQQTEQDGKATLRLFDKTDLVFRRLLKHIGMELPSLKSVALKPVRGAGEWCARVPYDRRGRRLSAEQEVDQDNWTVLDLNEGARVKLTEGHNCQGCRQPQYKHIGALKPTRRQKGGPLTPPGNGLGRVVGHDPSTSGIRLSIDNTRMLLGEWWLDAAIRGGPELLPVVNYSPSTKSTAPSSRTQRQGNRSSKPGE